MLKAISKALPGVMILEYEKRDDARGPVYKCYSKAKLAMAGIHTEFIEEYLYCPAKKGTLYGIHFQNNPKPQAKLISCVKGRCMDYAVDLRKGSPTYRQWVCAELSPENRRQLYVPRGFGHALVTLMDDTHIVFMIDECFDPMLSRAITYRDSELNIPFGVENPILSQQDRDAPELMDSDCNL